MFRSQVSGFPGTLVHCWALGALAGSETQDMNLTPRIRELLTDFPVIEGNWGTLSQRRSCVKWKKYDWEILQNKCIDSLFFFFLRLPFIFGATRCASIFGEKCTTDCSIGYSHIHSHIDLKTFGKIKQFSCFNDSLWIIFEKVFNCVLFSEHTIGGFVNSHWLGRINEIQTVTVDFWNKYMFHKKTVLRCTHVLSLDWDFC